MFTHLNKCLIVTQIGYPFGGGEEFLLQTTQYMSQEHNIQTMWIQFVTPDLVPYPNFDVIKKPHCVIIHINKPMTQDIIEDFIFLYKPNFIHTQGGMYSTIKAAASTFGIPILLGHHFWTNCVELDPHTFNMNITNHTLNHRCIIDNDINVHHYVPSEFVKTVIETVPSDHPLPPLHIMYASSSKDHTHTHVNVTNNKYILQVNIHHLKGGEILKHLIGNTPYQYIAIQTEPGSEQLDNEIKTLCESSRSQYYTRMDSLKDIYSKTKVCIIPSLVDETFCRVGLECAYNGIPVITSGQGNIRYLLGDAAIYCDVKNNDEWTKEVKRLCSNSKLLSEYSNRIKERSKQFGEPVVRNQLSSIFEKINSDHPNQRVVFLGPFCDQGLGIQIRHYVRCLQQDNTLTPYVYSYQSYFGDCQKEMQMTQSEWDMGDIGEVYYDSNIREDVDPDDVLRFIRKHRIGKCIIPEACWGNVFRIAAHLRANLVKCIVIPNVETVRNDELHLHSHFNQIFCNNKLCYTKFKERGFSNLTYIGFTIPRPLNFQKPQPNDEFTFVCIGGMNAFTRKMVHKVCEAYVSGIINVSTPSRLIVTIQGNSNPELIKPYIGHPSIVVIDKAMSHQNILGLVLNSDVCIQVSGREGLGLGFYEALSCSTPVLTLNTQPHNEVIKHNVNGWHVNCTYSDLPDNSDGIIQNADFTVQDLAKRINQILTYKIKTISKDNVFKSYDEMYPVDKFCKTFVSEINKT